MTAMTAQTLRERLLAGVAMMELGIELMRNNIRRRLGSTATDQEVSKVLKSWLFGSLTDRSFKSGRNDS